ncbi:MAG: MOSC domain-containing protein [Elioraea sp.]|nr:MOSC domain-containing protein [Elioraea sp.]MDW8442920.1 MOSC domain-containing protein [Acetobacteraceae bacterium]MDW8443655.1 MOSC domain-containing protein [Acetobacteraceae bacterium]
MRVETLYRYPVKGLTAEALGEVRLAAGQAIPGDRMFALAQGDAPFDEAAPAWLHKRHFGCLMANPRLAAVHASWDERRGMLLLRLPGEAPFAGDTTTPEGRSAIGARLAAALGGEARGTPRLVHAPGHHFADHPDRLISLINLASLAALERAMGRALDPLRFRANLYFSGAPAWAEQGWIGRLIEAGSATLRVVEPIERCAATGVNPLTAERDCDPVQGLRAAFGHAELGVYARVEQSGRIAVGDALVLREEG